MRQHWVEILNEEHRVYNNLTWMFQYDDNRILFERPRARFDFPHQLIEALEPKDDLCINRMALMYVFSNDSTKFKRSLYLPLFSTLISSIASLFEFISKRDAVSKINLVDSIATILNFQTNSTELITKHTVAELHIKEWYPKRFSDAPTCRRVQSVIQTLYFLFYNIKLETKREKKQFYARTP